MERIDRKYAIIYVDRTGECLDKSDYVPDEIIDDYYGNHEDFLQWNFYMIIAKKSVNPDDIKTIENNDRYCRKYVIADNKIKSFIDEWFPILQSERGHITLIKGDSHVEAEDLAWIAYHKTKSKSLYMGWHRDYSLMYSLSKMDRLRAALINSLESKVVFGTHMSNEYSLAEKKFKLFLNTDVVEETHKE